MLRKSLLVLLAAVLLSLALTILYAALRLGGPAEAVDEAEALQTRGEYARAVALLELAERSNRLRADEQKWQRLLRCRFECYVRLENYAAALDDIVQLLATHPADEAALRPEHVRMLALTGKGEAALALADLWREQTPNDARAHELAGEAAQSLYQKLLGTVAAAIERDAGPAAAVEAQRDLFSYLYRPDGDPEIANALGDLAARYQKSSPLLAEWSSLLPSLGTLRGQIQASLVRFRSSLEAGGEPVAAFRGLSLSLQQARRLDDVILLCEAYRRQFHHRYVLQAGSVALWTLLQHGQLVAAVATADRWLPPAEEEKLQSATEFPSGLESFLTARSLAAYLIGDNELVMRQSWQVYKLSKAGANIAVAQAFSSAVGHLTQGQMQYAPGSTNWLLGLAAKRGVPVDELDLLPAAVALRMNFLQRTNASIEECTDLLMRWVADRPGTLQPMLALIDYQLGVGRGAAAAQSCLTATELAPYNEDVLERHLAAARLRHQGTDQDGPSLLAQCARRGVLVPEVADPLGLFLCAEAALAQNNPLLAPLAVATARAATDRFPWSRQGVLLQARAQRLAGEPRAALLLLDKLLDSSDRSPSLLRDAMALRTELGMPIGPLAQYAIAAEQPSAPTLGAMLAATPRQARATAKLFAQQAMPLFAEAPELLPRCAAVFAAAGDLAQADALLAQCRKHPNPSNLWRHDLADAVLARIAAERGADHEQAAKASEQLLLDYDLRTPSAAEPLLATARSLASTRPHTALSLLRTGLAVAPASMRSGADFTLAGELALRLGDFRLAEESWTAALGFSDGTDAVEPLARLLLAEQRWERSKEVYAFAQKRQDAGLLLAFGGEKDAAEGKALAQAQLRIDRTDLVANAALLLFGDSSAADLTLPEPSWLPRIARILAVLREPKLAPAVVPDCQALVATLPQSRTATLLLAEALHHAGNGKQAAALHAAAHAKQATDVLLLGSAARLAEAGGYVLSKPLADALTQAVASDLLAPCPAAAAVASRQAIASLQQIGNLALANTLRGEFMAKQPIAAGATLEDARQLLANNQSLQAWWLLERLLPTLPPESTHAALTLQMAAARAALASDGNLRVMLTQAALAANRLHPGNGAVVHFLLDLDPAGPGKPNELHALWLGQHCDHIAQLGSDDGLLRSSAERLSRLLGTSAALAGLEAALAKNPTCIALWLARTDLKAQLSHAQAAIQELRRVIAAGGDAAARVEFTILASRYHALQADDIVRFLQIPIGERTTPRGLFASGLAALHSGRPREAAPLLMMAQPEPDGLHLLSLAQAVLIADDDGLARASELLARLSKDYPSSSLAANAGSFARQFAPREATAAPSPSNR